jgi:DNA-directed RNA polymerase
MTDRIIGTEEIQAQLEVGMKEETHRRYLMNLEKAIERHEEVGTMHGQRLLTLHTDTYSKAVQEWMEEAVGKRGRRHSALTFLQQIDSRTAAWLALREIVNRIQQRNLRLTTLGLVIGRSILTEIEMRKLKKEDKALYTGILRVADKKSQLARKEACARFLQEKAGHEVASASSKDCLLLGIKMVELAVEKLGIISLNLKGSVSNGKTTVHQRAYIVEPTPELLQWIKAGHEQWIDMAPVYEPMVVPPAKWVDPLTGGYLTNEVKPLTMVKTRSKRYFKRLAKCTMPQVYEALNRIQETPWRINHNILAVIQQLLDTGSQVGGLPPTELLPLPEKPADIGTNEEAKKAYKVAALRVHEENVRIIGRSAKVNSIVRTAEKYADFAAIYFPHQLDFRGRVYPVTQLSPQGEDFVKALLEFAEGEPLGTEQAADWLAVHIANLFGVDKVDFTTRILWTWENDRMLREIAADPFSNRQWEDADKPFQALAAAFEWAGYREHGLSWVSRIPVALDGSCSGLQNFGMALRCERTGKAVNLLPGDRPADIYQDVIDQVHTQLIQLAGDNCAQITTEAILNRAREAIRQYCPKGQNFDAWLLQVTQKQYDEEGKPLKKTDEEKEIYNRYWDVIAAAAWLRYGVDQTTGKMSRKIAKRAVMTFPYGSKEYGFRDQLKEDIVRPDIQKDPEGSVFKDIEWVACGLMARLLWEAVNRVVVKAAEAMDWLQQAASLVAKEGERVSWQTPLGFLVEQGYVKTEEKLVETTFAGKEKVRLTLPTDTTTPDTRKQASGIAPNYVHSLDSSHLMLTVARAPDIKSWALIHDSFGTLPSRTQSLFTYIRVAFVELYSTHDVLDEFRGQVLKQLASERIEDLPPVPAKGHLDLNSVLQSKYCFA